MSRPLACLFTASAAVTFLAVGILAASAQETIQRGVATIAPPAPASPFPPAGPGMMPQTGTATIQSAPIQTAPMMTAPPVQARPTQAPPCFDDFLPLRNEAEKRAAAIRNSGRGASAAEVCKLFNGFIAAESKMLKFMEANTSCGIPPDAVAQVKANHAGAMKTRQQVCAAASAPAARPAAPGLSEALGARAPTAGSSGLGTWDTLSGTPAK